MMSALFPQGHVENSMCVYDEADGVSTAAGSVIGSPLRVSAAPPRVSAIELRRTSVAVEEEEGSRCHAHAAAAAASPAKAAANKYHATTKAFGTRKRKRAVDGGGMAGGGGRNRRSRRQTNGDEKIREEEEERGGAVSEEEPCELIAVEDANGRPTNISELSLPVVATEKKQQDYRKGFRLTEGGGGGRYGLDLWQEGVEHEEQEEHAGDLSGLEKALERILGGDPDSPVGGDEDVFGDGGGGGGTHGCWETENIGVGVIDDEVEAAINELPDFFAFPSVYPLSSPLDPSAAVLTPNAEDLLWGEEGGVHGVGVDLGDREVQTPIAKEKGIGANQRGGDDTRGEFIDSPHPPSPGVSEPSTLNMTPSPHHPQPLDLFDEAAAAFLPSPRVSAMDSMPSPAGGLIVGGKHQANQEEEEWDVALELRGATSAARRGRARQQPRDKAMGAYKGKAQPRIDHEMSRADSLMEDEKLLESTSSKRLDTFRFPRAFICADRTGYCNLTVRIQACLSSVARFELPADFYNSIDCDPLFDAPPEIANQAVRTPIRERRSSVTMSEEQRQGRKDDDGGLDDIDILTDFSRSSPQPHHTPVAPPPLPTDMASPFLRERAARGSLDMYRLTENSEDIVDEAAGAEVPDNMVNEEGKLVVLDAAQIGQHEDMNDLWGSEADKATQDACSQQGRGSGGSALSLYSMSAHSQNTEDPATRASGVLDQASGGGRGSGAAAPGGGGGGVVVDQSGKLLRRLRKEVETSGSEELSFDSIMKGHTRETSVRAFMDILHLATRQHIEVHQAQALGDIAITPGVQFLNSRVSSPAVSPISLHAYSQTLGACES
eukprot:GHVS01008239.1.p1 GENE.GHVS01008239.1~~GHVS01008239.1.p1  ORF type:complete len:833 (+),score=192.77 GHVS01008239.1:141-2639(+)